MILPVLLTLAQAATAAPQAPAAAPPAKPKLICLVEDETGSRLSAKRVCRTKAEWDAIKAEMSQSMDLKQRNTTK